MKFTNDQLGAIGFISEDDRKGFELDPRAITDGRNVRCEDGAIVPIRGFQSVLSPPITPLWADYALSSTGSWWVIFDETTAYGYDGSSYFNVTGSGFDVNLAENLHSTTRLSGILCVTDGKTVPKAQYDEASPESTNASTSFIDLPGWNSGEACRILIAHKNYLIAMGITTTSQFLPNAIRWSDAAAPGKLPETWVPDATNDASDITIIGADSGAIVGAQLLRDDVIIYTETATYRLYFVGGDDVYNVRRIFRNRGMYGQRCVGEFRGRHYVITDDDVIVHDGVTASSIADARTRKYLQSRLKKDNKNYVMLYGHRAESELGIIYSPTGAAEPATESITYNVLNNAWNTPQDEPSLIWKKDMPDLNFQALDADRWDDEITPDDTWDTGPPLPAVVAIGDLVDAFNIFGGADSGVVYQLNVGNEWSWSGNPNGTYAIHYFKNEDLNFSGDGRTNLVQKLYPKLQSAGQVDISVGGKDSMDEPFAYDASVSFDPNTDHEIDARTTGRRNAIDFRNDDGEFFRIYGYEVEFRDTGKY